MPFFWKNSQHRSTNILAVTHTDLATDEVSHLDAVSVGMTQ